jgi:hypothetical protein
VPNTTYTIFLFFQAFALERKRILFMVIPVSWREAGVGYTKPGSAVGVCMRHRITEPVFGSFVSRQGGCAEDDSHESLHLGS